MPKVLFLTLHRKDRSPGQRFRHEQYLDYLAENGFEIVYSHMLNEKQDQIFYGRGGILKKMNVGISSLFKRIKDVFRANKFDYIFIYRDAFFFGIAFEWLFKHSKAKLIFDFDDSIWLRDENPNQSLFQRLKNPSKTSKIISYCDSIVAGNEYLKKYALQYNENITIIPTTIDTQEYSPIASNKKNNPICIGWSGSFSTIKHFESALEPLKSISERYGDKIKFKVIGDGNYKNEYLRVRGLPWKKDTEIEDLCDIDIGIMPLPNDSWSEGKCGLKGLQYMALGIPTIMSPVGVNADIVKDGENGFLAAIDEEWVEKISLLIEDKDLRERMGKAGRKTVEDRYSVEANKTKWLEIFQD